MTAASPPPRQLCINFTNERLQQKFNRNTFSLEETLYQEEGVPFDKVPPPHPRRETAA